MSGTVTQLPVAITLTGDAAFQQSVTRLAQDGTRGMQRFRTAVQQGGFQLQDFVVQVQSGTNALTALSQQGSQFLGVFGPTGAIAGVVLALGAVAAQFLLGRDNASQLNDAIDTQSKLWDDALSAANAYSQSIESQIEQVRRLTEYYASLSAEVREYEARRLASARNVLEDQRTGLRERALDAVGGNLPRRFANAGAIGDAARLRGQTPGELPAVVRDAVSYLLEFQASGEGSPQAIAALASRLREASLVESTAQKELQAAVERLDALMEDARRIEEQIARNSTQAEALSGRAITVLPPPVAPGPDTGGSSRGGRASREYDPREALARIRQDTEREYRAIVAAIDPATAALQRYEEQQNTLLNALNFGVITEEQFAEAVEGTSVALAEQLDAIERRGETVDRTGQQLGWAFSSAFEDALVKGKEFSDVLKGLEQDIARIILRTAVTQPLGNALGTIGQGLGGWVSGLFSGGAGGGLKVPFGGARASGGPVDPGHAFLVGEDGPEIFRPGRAGTIIPNHALGGSVFAPTYNIDARGAAPGTEARLRAQMTVISRQAVAEFVDSINRGGAAARTVGRRR